MATGDELDINRNASATQMAEAIFGDSINIIDAEYDGWRNSSGIFSNGDSISAGATPSDTGVILSTGDVRNFTQSNGDPNRSPSTSTNTPGDSNNPLFNNLAGNNTFDASFLTVNFVPDTDVLSIQFSFASEEYPEFTGSVFNDAVGIWMNGELVESPIFEVTQINSVNQSENETLFVDNTGDDFNTEMDGFTVTLTVLMPVNVGEENELIIGIADVADSSYDSSLLIAGNSIQGAFIANDDTVTVTDGRTALADVLSNDGSGGVMLITQINGVDVDPGDTVTLSTGVEITLTATGQLSVEAPATPGGLTDPTVANFSYTVADTATGLTDTAFVTVTTVPCFVKGTRIRTPDGEKLVENLEVGDLVDTRDHGPQPIRWIGNRTVPAKDNHTPIVIEAGTFGHHDRLVVSPQHRVLLTHWMSELMFGEDEVLVAAKDLVNGVSVRELPGGEVTYFHILFDDHQIVWSEGLLTESFLPGPQVMSCLDTAVRDEVLSLFPEIDPDTHHGYGPSARPGLRAFEARALLG